MTKSGDEILLIQRFKNGDEKAFELLFEKHHKKLYGFLYNLFGTKHDAEEIVQDTFVKIWEKRADFNTSYSFESFLFTIAKNAFLNHNRKKVNRKVVESDLGLIINNQISNDTENYVLFNETRDIIQTIIDDLPPKRKEIFLLRRIEGLSRKEIAEKLGISVVTVDSHILKANKHLKEELKKYSVLLLIFALS